MSSKLNSIYNKLLAREDALGLTILDSVLTFMIPFNSAHKIKLKTFKKDCIETTLPYVRANHNHLKTIHACAMATIGEYTAGLLLLKNLGLGQYRYILSHLEVKYHRQAKCELRGKAELSQDALTQLKTNIQIGSKADIQLVTQLFNPQGECVSEIFSTWQVKEWTKVTYR
jgi:acyl-coenzyme A thioesterase PaaI-like protein